MNLGLPEDESEDRASYQSESENKYWIKIVKYITRETVEGFSFPHTMDETFIAHMAKFA